MTDFHLVLTKNESPVQKIDEVVHKEKGIQLFLKREDLLDKSLSGNKWRKLKYNLIEAKKQGHTQLLSFGGAYSNHIYALAAAGKYFDFKTIGIIRGEASAQDNPTLQFARSCGMHLHFVNRATYRLKSETDFLSDLGQMFGSFYHIPEGGTNELAIKGCEEIIMESQFQINADIYCVPVGTGGTIAGMIAGLDGAKKVLGFSALKGNFLKKEVADLLIQYRQVQFNNWEINTQYHFGGYAKFDKPVRSGKGLIQFIKDFKEKHGIPLDPIYTGKMMYGIYDLIEQNYFPKGGKILAIHTGGLQGLMGFRERFGML